MIHQGQVAHPVRGAVGGMAALAVGIGVGRFVYTPILPPMMAVLGLTPAAAGLIAAANYAGYLAGAVLAAGATLPGGRDAWLRAGLAGSAGSTMAMGLGHGVVGFMLLRFLGGLASALVLVLASVMVLDQLATAGRAGLSALLFAGVGVGIAASAALVSGLRAADVGWAGLWLGAGALAVVAALPAWLWVPAEPAVGPVGGRMGGGRTAPHRWPRGAWRLAVAYGLFGFGYVITGTFLVVIVRASPVLRPQEPVIWILFGMAAVPSVAGWTALARRIGVGRSFALAALIEAVGVVASVAWPTPAGVVLAAVLVGGTFMGLTALGLLRGRMAMRGDARRFLAVLTCAFGIGQCLGPAVAGVLAARFGGFGLSSGLAALALVGAACLTLPRDQESVP